MRYKQTKNLHDRSLLERKWLSGDFLVCEVGRQNNVFYLRQVEGENNNNIGKISKRPANISRDKTILLNMLYSL